MHKGLEHVVESMPQGEGSPGSPSRDSNDCHSRSTKEQIPVPKGPLLDRFKGPGGTRLGALPGKSREARNGGHRSGSLGPVALHFSPRWEHKVPPDT